MTQYAGFKDLCDYLDQRCARDKISQNALSERIGFRRNYIHCAYKGQFKPSRQAVDKLADVFGDDPYILRVLVGLETPPPALTDKMLRQINSLAASLDVEGRRKAIEYLHLLAGQKKRR